jgi:hypothetical protein
MTVHTFATYTILCDEPGCDADFVEQWSDGDYSGFGSLDDMPLSDRDWIERAGKHYCGEHADAHPEDADAPTPPETDPTDLPPTMFDIEPQQETP